MRRLGLLVLAGLCCTSPAQAARPTLKAFTSCKSLVSYAHRGELRTGGNTGVVSRVATSASALPGTVFPARASDGSVPPAAASPSTTTAAAESGAAGDASFSGTTTQEAGVDEPDVVKTDGTRLLVVDGGLLRVFLLDSDQPREVGRLALEGFNQQILLRGDRVLVIAEGGATGVVEPAQPVATARVFPGYVSGKVLLTEVSIANPAAPEVRRSLELDGRFAGARLTGGTARIVSVSSPQVVTYQQPETLQDAVAATKLRRYVPLTTLRSRVSGRTFQRGVVDCDEVRRPRDFSGLDLVTVLTVDLDKGLFSVDRDAIMAGAEVVYGSTSSLVVAARRWYPTLDGAIVEGDQPQVPPRVQTDLYRFDASQPAQTTYSAGGSVPGFVLNQFAISEADGRLRVATTEEPQWLGGDVAGTPSQSAISVLEEHDGKLGVVGRVGGLGKGERIYAARFVGDVAYLVTFRQVDPLYTVDLSDPRAPRVRGELPLLGYSSYLEPLPDGRLLGVGQDATPEGRTQGTQLQLFDVSDVANPRKVGGLALGTGTSSDAEHDHHAFLFWPPSALAVVPYVSYNYSDEKSKPSAGAIGVRVGDGLSEVARVQHPAPASSSDAIVPIGRSVVVGDRLLTVSQEGIATNRLPDLTPVSYAAYAPAG